MANQCRRESFTIVSRVDIVKVPSAKHLSEENIEIMRRIYDGTPSTEVITTRFGETIFVASAFAAHAVALGSNPDELLQRLGATLSSTTGQIVFDLFS